MTLAQEIKSTNTLAAELINEHEYTKIWDKRETGHTIKLTDEQVQELHQGFAEGRGAWGLAETTLGQMRWDVARKFLGLAGYGDYELTYQRATPPESTQSTMRFHLTGRIFQKRRKKVTMQLEAWANSLDRKDKILKRWKALKATNIQEEVLREPTEDEESEDVYYQVTGKTLKRAS